MPAKRGALVDQSSQRGGEGREDLNEVVRPTSPLRRVLPMACAVVLLFSWTTAVGCAGGQAGGEAPAGQLSVLADTTFLADIVQNVAGDRMTVSAIVPAGADPHSFEPTPKDAKRVVEAQAVVISVSGLIPTVDELVAGAAESGVPVIDASAGLPGIAVDPHFWLDPLSVVASVDSIAEGFGKIDPAGAEVYRANAAAYQVALRELDAWIVAQVATIAPERRLLVTNHESFGRFASRYGFQLVGTIFATTSGEGSPSARQLAELIGAIRNTGAPAIFLETGSNAALAEQVARETGVTVVTDLYTHSLGENAATYVDMMRWNVGRIVEALR
jgi:ABC-type Zn uptake system ZnuABC Zn-binding protein ZnuA